MYAKRISNRGPWCTFLTTYPLVVKKQNTYMGTAASDTMTEPAQQGTIRHMRGAVIDARRNEARRNVPNSVLPIRDDNATTLIGTIESQKPNE